MPIYKLAAFDMDGTLLNSRKQIPDSAVSACRRAQKAGRIIAVDTGRAVSELTPFSFAEMGIRYGSCACGTVGARCANVTGRTVSTESGRSASV